MDNNRYFLVSPATSNAFWKPGGQGVIRITYEPHKSEPGVFNKVIQVYSNSVDGRDVITVSSLRCM